VPAPFKDKNADGLPRHQIDKMKNDTRIGSCEDIVQDDSISSFQSFLQTTNRKRLENIENPKENKPNDDETNGFGNPEHGDEKTDYLIDNDPLIIFFAKKSLGIF
jgi:hypothetical protein